MNKIILEALKNKTCTIYTRVSSKSQVEGTSLDGQIELCSHFAQNNGFKIAQIRTEDASARKANKRKEFKAMIEDIKNGKCGEIIIFATADRMSRNATDYETLLEFVEKQELTLVFLKENIILKNPINASDKLTIDILMSVSNYHVNHLNYTCRLGLTNRATSGFRPCKAPYGYVNDPKKKLAVVIPKEANFVKRAFELYATNEYSLFELSEKLCDEGYIYQLQPNGMIPKQSLVSILKNRFYTGYYWFGTCNGLIKGAHKSIVSEDLFDKVQKILGETPIQTKRNSFLYSKLIQCTDCGNYMIGDLKTKPNGKEYLYYRCLNSKCDHKVSTNATQIDESLYNYLNEVRLQLIPKTLIKKVSSEELADLIRQKSILKRNVSRKYHSKLANKGFIDKNGIDDKDYIEQIDSRISQKYEGTESQLDSIDNSIAIINANIEKMLSKRLSEVYISLNKDDKRKVIEIVKNKLTLKDKRLKMTFKSAFRKIRKR